MKMRFVERQWRRRCELGHRQMVYKSLKTGMGHYFITFAHTLACIEFVNKMKMGNCQVNNNFNATMTVKTVQVHCSWMQSKHSFKMLLWISWCSSFVCLIYLCQLRLKIQLMLWHLALVSIFRSSPHSIHVEIRTIDIHIIIWASIPINMDAHKRCD